VETGARMQAPKVFCALSRLLGSEAKFQGEDRFSEAKFQGEDRCSIQA
jgi:hypothetical protein